MSVEDRIERGLILFLREERGVTARSAWIGLSEMEKGYGGCDTCGYGGSEASVTTPIYYAIPDSAITQVLEIDGTSLDLLPKLIDFIERAN